MLLLHTPLLSLDTKIENHWLEGEAQNPEALESIKNMEFMKSSMALGDGQPMEVDFDLPTFTSHINDVNCEEGRAAKFECSVEPKTDPSLQTGKSHKLLHQTHEIYSSPVTQCGSSTTSSFPMDQGSFQPVILAMLALTFVTQ